MNQTPHPPAILIVDDDRMTLTLLEYTVHNLAPTYDILTAEDAYSALNHLTKRSIPLLVTDYMMPGMDGFELTDAAKAASPEIYVIVISADDSAAVQQLARAHKVDTFLSKTALREHLGAVVRRVLPAASPDEAT